MTDRQLYKHFMGLARDTTHRDSPYAQPPPMHLFKLHRGKVSKSTPSSPAMARKPKTGTQTVAPSHTAKLPTRNTPDVEAESRLHRSKYHRRSFSLPTVKVTVPKHREVNVDDLPELRKQADAIRKQFLQEQGLKGKSMFQKHWVNVKGNEISSDNLKSRMKTTFNVYSSNINTPRPVPL